MARIGTDEAKRIYTLAAERGLTEDQVDELAHSMRLMMGTVGIDGLSRNGARQLIAALPAAAPAPRPASARPSRPSTSPTCWPAAPAPAKAAASRQSSTSTPPTASSTSPQSTP